MSNIFQEVFVRPVFNLLIFIYNFLPRPDLGVAVIMLVILVRLALWPIFTKGVRSQLMFSKLQPEVERIQKKYKDDRVTQTQELLKLYREHKFNPFSSLILLFVQIPILIALYKVFLQGVKGADFSLLYASVPNPGTLNPVFLGLVDLTVSTPALVILAGLAQFFQSRMLMPKTPSKNPASFQATFSRQMMWLGPFITVAVLWGLPSVIAVFWFLTTVISIGQQYWIEKKIKISTR